METSQYDFALDADDPQTARQTGFMLNAPFAQKLTIENLTTQKSFLITDLRLRSLDRENNDRLFGPDLWAIDIYHKLAGFESQPGVNTQVVNVQGQNMYNRYDDRTLTPDLPMQKTTYQLSDREVDLLIHAGAYRDPDATEATLRKNLVGQTWSMPDQVQVVKSKFKAPTTRVAYSLDPGAETNGDKIYNVMLVRDVGKQHLIDAHTTDSNMAVVMDNVLRQMAPGVQPMADVQNDLENARGVKVSSRGHQVKSQVLNQELDLGNSFDDDYEAGLPTKNAQSSADLNDLVSADDQQKQTPSPEELRQQTEMAQDQSEIDQVFGDTKKPVATSQMALNMHTRQQMQQQVRRRTERQAVQAEDQSQNLNLTSDNSGAMTRQVAQPANNDIHNDIQHQTASQQNKAMSNSSMTTADLMDAHSDAPMSEEELSSDELQKMLNDLQQDSGVQNFVEPDYEAEASNSPAAKRQRLKLRRQQIAAKEAAKEAAQAAVNEPVENDNLIPNNVPKFEGPDL